MFNISKKGLTQHQFSHKGVGKKLASKTGAGFTLVELIVVIAVAAVLSVAAFVALKPEVKIGNTNNAVRSEDAKAIERAIKSVLLDSDNPPSAITNISEGTYYSLVSSGASTDGNYTCDGLGQDIARLDIASTIEPYIGSQPVDPEISSGSDSGYYLVRTGNLFDVGNCNWYEAPEPIIDSYAQALSITETNDYHFGQGTTGTISVVGTDSAAYLSLEAATGGNSDQVDTTELAYGLDVSGNYAYVGVDEGPAPPYQALNIIEISNPADISVVGVLDGLSNIRDVEAYGNYAYLGTAANVTIVDISNPSSPIGLSYITGAAGAALIEYVGILFVSSWSGCAEYGQPKLSSFDLSNPTNPTGLSTASPGCNSSYAVDNTVSGAISIFGNYAYTLGSDYGSSVLSIWDISTPSSLSNVSNLQLEGNPYYIEEIWDIAAYSDSYTFIATGEGILVIDVSNKTAPTVYNTYNSGDIYYGLDATSGSGYLYASNATDNTVEVLDISDINNISIVNSYPVGANPYGLEMFNDTLYIPSTGSTFDVIELTTYNTSGTFTSQALDTVYNDDFSTVSWTETKPENTGISVLIRTGNSSDMSDATAWGVCTPVTNGSDISSNNCVTDGDRYVQYYVAMSTTDTNTTPRLEDFTINFNADSAENYCGDGLCSAAENISSCVNDCSHYCGDYYCTGSESTINCPSDCGSSCGDSACNGGELCSTCQTDCGVCNSPPTISDAGRWPTNGLAQTLYDPVDIYWDAWTDPNGDIVEYYTNVWNSLSCQGVIVSPGYWSTDTSHTITEEIYNHWNYSWKTKARDQNHQDESDWNTCYSWTNATPKSSCPFVYVWNRDQYEYVTDIKGQVIGFPDDHFKAKFTDSFIPNQIPVNNWQPEDGIYKLKLRETLNEMDYFDELKLILVDHPEGYDIYSSTASDHQTLEKEEGRSIFYTVKDPRLPISAFDQGGKDVLQEISFTDNNIFQDYNNFDSYVELDFGEIDPSNTKLLIDAWTIYQVSRSRGEKPYVPYVEVKNEKGEWQKVQEFGFAQGDLKTMVVDMRDKFITDDYRMRVHVGWHYTAATFVDRIILDDSEEVDITINTVAVDSADLYHAGFTPYEYTNTEHRLMSVEDIRMDDIENFYFHGEFTKYGDVKELLDEADDKFVMMRHGDAIDATFQDLPAPQAGHERTPVVHADVFYKIIYNDKTGRFKKVEDPYNAQPLPFKAMTKYPYDTSIENYPYDQEHLDYIDKWNTRVCEEDKDYCYDKHTGHKILTPYQIEQLDQAHIRLLKGVDLPDDKQNLEYAKEHYNYQFSGPQSKL